MIEIGRNGMVKKVVALSSGLPIYDFVLSDSPGIHTNDYWTKKELELLRIILDKHEQENLIIGFLHEKGFRGYLPLYSLKEVLAVRGY